MKAIKGLFLAFAGLGLFACTNDDLNKVSVDGNAVVSVRIDDPALSRAIEAGAYSGSTEVVLNSIKLVLTAQTGGNEMTFTLADAGGDRAKLLENVSSYQFTGVRNPSKMEVFINTEKPSGWSLDEIVGAGLAEPLYAYSSNFQSKGDTDGDGINEYEIALAPGHTVARLEFGGIKHIHTAGKSCMFATINIDGIFLNKLAGTTAPTDWESAQTNIPAHSVIGPVPFEENLTWPADGKCYGYNILPTTEGNLPILTVCFSDITIDNSNPEYSGLVWGNTEGLGYATVKNYKLDKDSEGYRSAFGAGDDNIIKIFPAGYIYQVKSLEIPDEAIGTTIEGGEDVHIYAVVTVSDWNLATGTVEWN